MLVGHSNRTKERQREFTRAVMTALNLFAVVLYTERTGPSVGPEFIVSTVNMMVIVFLGSLS